MLVLLVVWEALLSPDHGRPLAQPWHSVPHSASWLRSQSLDHTWSDQSVWWRQILNNSWSVWDMRRVEVRRCWGGVCRGRANITSIHCCPSIECDFVLCLSVNERQKLKVKGYHLTSLRSSCKMHMESEWQKCSAALSIIQGLHYFFLNEIILLRFKYKHPSVPGQIVRIYHNAMWFSLIITDIKY